MLATRSARRTAKSAARGVLDIWPFRRGTRWCQRPPGTAPLSPPRVLKDWRALRSAVVAIIVRHRAHRDARREEGRTASEDPGVPRSDGSNSRWRARPLRVQESLQVWSAQA